MKELRKKAKALKPIISIGKGGISDGLLALLNRELDQKEFVKIKLLRAFLATNDRRDAAEQLARRSRSKLVQAVGNTVVLHRRGKTL